MDMKSGYGFQWIDRRRIESVCLTSIFPFRQINENDRFILSFEQEYLDWLNHPLGLNMYEGILAD